MPSETFPYRLDDYTIQIVLQPTDDGHMAYFATIEEFLACDSDGPTPDEARRNLEEAFDLYVSTALSNGVNLPPPRTHERVRIKELVWRDVDQDSDLRLVGVA